MYNKKLADLFSKAQFDVTEQLQHKSEIKKSKVYFDFQATPKTPIHESFDEHFSLSNESYIEQREQGLMPVAYYNVKSEIRRLFGKNGDVSEKIGCHPDFYHLQDSEKLEHGYAVTMFFDIVGSTKLGLTYTPDIVFNIKNTIIKYVIEIIQAFDGHIHRIMGDAVMAFFRSSEKSATNSKMDSGVDAINAGVYILEFMKQVITPALGDVGADEPVGVRIGIDFAEDEKIIWGNYGASGAFEVTATSYFVDVAAKLQQAAKTNSIMIGDSFKKLLGFGDEYVYLKCKRITDESGRSKEIKIPYVKPIYKIRGELKPYKQYQFDSEKYFKLLPYGLSGDAVTIRLRVTSKGITKYIVCPCSISLDKNSELIFEVEYKHSSHGNYTAIFEKQNTGPEAKINKATEKVVTRCVMRLANQCYYAEKNENTLYHGIHHMKVSVSNSVGDVIDSTVFSIFIK